MRRQIGLGILCIALAVGMTAAIGTGCQMGLDRIREHTYPPSFDYITKEQLQSVMWQMARDSKRIDELVHAPEGIGPEQRDEIVRLLGFMLQASKKLGTERTNHPVIDEHRDAFQADLDAARRGVLSTPPNYTLAENVAGACVHCHKHATR